MCSLSSISVIATRKSSQMLMRWVSLLACRISACVATLGQERLNRRNSAVCLSVCSKPKRCLHLAAYQSLPLSGCLSHLTSKDIITLFEKIHPQKLSSITFKDKFFG